MRITAITAYVVKAGKRYELAGQAHANNQLPASDYLRFGPYPQLYSQRSEALIIKVETDEGITGWGETQAPVGPEVAQTIVERVLGPAVLGRDPLATNVRFMDMYETLRVRGQVSGYQLDAIAGLDTAFWDIRGKAAGRSIAALLGGRFRDELPCYVTGLRGSTLPERVDEAVAWASQGMGIKPCLGFGVCEDSREVEALRDALPDDARLMVDGVWRYSFPEAVQVARAFEANGVAFFESPLSPEDVSGHARLAAKVDVPIAVGEPLRTRYAFLPWLQSSAMSICQPDLMRNGVSETAKIAALAETFNLQVALHTGVVTPVGMAASWQVASTLPNFVIQEFQPVMCDLFNRWLMTPIGARDGALVIPNGPGLGIEIDEDAFSRDVDSVLTVRLP